MEAKQRLRQLATETKDRGAIADTLKKEGYKTKGGKAITRQWVSFNLWKTKDEPAPPAIKTPTPDSDAVLLMADVIYAEGIPAEQKIKLLKRLLAYRGSAIA